MKFVRLRHSPYGSGLVGVGNRYASVRPSERILFIVGEYPPLVGGVGDHVVKLGAELESMGFSCHVGTESRSKNDSGQRVHGINCSVPFRSVVEIVGLIRRVRPTVVHFHHQAGAYSRPSETMVAMSLLRWTGLVPFLAVTFHDLSEPYLFPKAGRIRAMLLGRLARVADALIYVDELDRRVLRARCGDSLNDYWIPAGPTIEPAPDVGNRDLARMDLGLSTDAFIVGYFGFRQPSKGVCVLAEAMRNEDLLQPGTRLALIGASGPGTNPRRAELVVSPDVFREIDVVESGPQSGLGVSRWITACDVIVLPFLDGLSARRGSFMNAVAHGIPVVTTVPKVAGSVNVHEDEVAFIPANDVGALVRTLVEIRDNRARRVQLAEGSRAIAARHTWTEIASQTRVAYGL